MTFRFPLAVLLVLPLLARAQQTYSCYDPVAERWVPCSGGGSPPPPRNDAPPPPPPEEKPKKKPAEKTPPKPDMQKWAREEQMRREAARRREEAKLRDEVKKAEEDAKAQRTAGDASRRFQYLQNMRSQQREELKAPRDMPRAEALRRLRSSQLPQPGVIHTAIMTKGEVTVVANSMHFRLPIANGSGLMTFLDGDRIITGPNSSATVLLPDQTVFTLGPNSDMYMDKYVYDSDPSRVSFVLRVLKGSFRSAAATIVGMHGEEWRKMTYAGPCGGGIRGTDYQVTLRPDDSVEWKVYDGLVEVKGDASDRVEPLGPGQSVVVDAAGNLGPVTSIPASDRPLPHL